MAGRAAGEGAPGGGRRRQGKGGRAGGKGDEEWEDEERQKMPARELGRHGGERPPSIETLRSVSEVNMNTIGCSNQWVLMNYVVNRESHSRGGGRASPAVRCQHL